MIFAANFTWDAFSQLTVSGVINGAAYGLLGVGFALILGVTGRFHFAYSFTYTLAAYMVFTFVERVGCRVLARAPSLGIVLGARRRRRRSSGSSTGPCAAGPGATALLAIFVASLGIAIAGQNLISLVFSSASQQTPRPRGRCAPRSMGPTLPSMLDVWQVLSGRGARPAASSAGLKFTPLGRSIKATRGNPEMARIIGIDPEPDLPGRASPSARSCAASPPSGSA